MNTFEKLEQHKTSREISCGAEYHAHALEKALNVFYWTGAKFHYEDAIAQFEQLVEEMAKMQNKFREEIKEG